jgi:hypothetical protein
MRRSVETFLIIGLGGVIGTNALCLAGALVGLAIGSWL